MYRADNRQGELYMTEKNTPRETAERLIAAGTGGENLMREVESIIGDPQQFGSRQKVFQEMLNLANTGQAPGLELVDSNGQPVTNERAVHTVDRIVRTGPDGRKETIYDGGGDTDARALMVRDNADILKGKVDDRTHPDDVKKIVDTFQKAVDDMVKNGQRLEGGGALMGILNNATRAYFNDNLKDCADQAVYVLNQLKQLNIGDRWDLHMVGDPPHYTLEAVPRSPNDPVISMDPWRGRNSYEVKGGAKPDERLNRWMDGDWNLRWR